LVHANKIEEDGRVLTSLGELLAFKGDYIITHLDGTTTVISEKELADSYVPVERVKPKIDLEKMALNYAQEWSTIDDTEYIETFQESVKKRNKENN
jgi:hypothetical protein